MPLLSLLMGWGFFCLEGWVVFFSPTEIQVSRFLKNQCRTGKCDHHRGSVIIQNKMGKVQLNVFLLNVFSLNFLLGKFDEFVCWKTTQKSMSCKLSEHVWRHNILQHFPHAGKCDEATCSTTLASGSVAVGEQGSGGTCSCNSPTHYIQRQVWVSWAKSLVQSYLNIILYRVKEELMYPSMLKHFLSHPNRLAVARLELKPVFPPKSQCSSPGTKPSTLLGDSSQQTVC